ncbi:MAG: AI-2E family transporter [Synergistaceae bacterium]|nr:AI-2E family transporter [Synergistaceae bacterium]
MNLNSEISKRKDLCQGDRVAFVFFMAFFAFLAWQVTHPLVKALMWAGMLSFIFKPVYKRIMELTRGRYRGLSAAVTLSLMAVVFIIPLIYIFASLGSETSKIIDTIAAFLARNKINQNTDLAQLTPHLTPIWLPEWLKGHFYNFLMDSEAVKDSVQKTAQWVGGNLTDISKYLIQGASSFLMEMILVPMISFFFIRDGDKIVDYIKSVTPLSTEEKEMFFAQTKKLLNSVIFGILLTVAVQALLGGLGWWFVGLSNPAFFGMLMFFFGLFPAGTALVWIPGGIYLILSGDIKGGVILIAWGSIIVGTIDNLLRPFLISGGKSGKDKGEDIPTLLVILGLFGGVIKWGFLGIFLGPLILVLFVMIFGLYRARYLKECDDSLL